LWPLRIFPLKSQHNLGSFRQIRLCPTSECHWIYSLLICGPFFRRIGFALRGVKAEMLFFGGTGRGVDSKIGRVRIALIRLLEQHRV
jgi:hypothetical protein